MERSQPGSQSRSDSSSDNMVRSQRKGLRALRPVSSRPVSSESSSAEQQVADAIR